MGMTYVRRLATRGGIAVALMVMLSGCAALPLAALGTVADVSSSIIGTGSEVFSLGKLDSVEHAKLGQCEVAVRQTVEQLHFRFTADQFDNESHTFTIADDHDDEIAIEIHSMTARVCAIRIDVGIFGSEPLARLLLRGIRAHLPADLSPATQQLDLRELNDLLDKAAAQ